jgi:hypothetical protein
LKIKSIHTLLGIAFYILLISSCTPRYTANYYRKNSATVNSIYNQYQQLYAAKPFSVEFRDKSYNFISLEIIKDTIRYIYKFHLDEPLLADTLDKYGFDKAGVLSLIHDMRSIKCTWINKMDFYVHRQKESMIYLSVREKRLDSWLKPEKYYTIAFFSQPQQFDPRGRVKATSRSMLPMRINNAIYWRITDRICYAITENFR